MRNGVNTHQMLLPTVEDHLRLWFRADTEGAW